MVQIKIKKLRPEAVIPKYKTSGAVGADLYALTSLGIPPGGTQIAWLGFAVEIPPGYEMQVRPRSGLAAKKNITVLNSPGTIDSDYRGEVGVILTNLGEEEFWISPGERIAQAVIASVPEVSYLEVQELVGTDRGIGGLGSTGRN